MEILYLEREEKRSKRLSEMCVSKTFCHALLIREFASQRRDNDRISFSDIPWPE